MEVKTTESYGRVSIEVTEKMNVDECYFPIVWKIMGRLPKFSLKLGQVLFNEANKEISAYREYYLSNADEQTKRNDKKFVKEAKQFMEKWTIEVRKTVSFIELIRRIINKDIDAKVRVAREGICKYIEEKFKELKEKQK